MKTHLLAHLCNVSSNFVRCEVIKNDPGTIENTIGNHWSKIFEQLIEQQYKLVLLELHVNIFIIANKFVVFPHN